MNKPDMKSGSLSVWRMLLVFLYLFVYGAPSSRSDDGTDLLLNLIGRLQARQALQSTGEGNADENADSASDSDENDEDADSDGESDMENYEYEEGPTIFDPYGAEEDDDETANNGEDEEYSDGLPRVGHAHGDEYDESAESDDEMMLDFFEDDFVINDRANAMDPVLLIAAAKNKLAPIERKGVIRRRDESQHEDEAEINDSASPNKRRKLDDGLVDDKFKKSNRNEFNDFLPALMGEGSSNGDGDGGKRDDKKLNDIWNGNKSKSPKNKPNKENKNNNSNNTNNNGEDDMSALVEDIDEDTEPAQQRRANASTAQQILYNPGVYNVLLEHRQKLRNNINNNQNTASGATNQGGSDDDMPILIDSDNEEDVDNQPRHESMQAEPIVIDDAESLPELTSEEESDDEDHAHGPVQQPHYPFSPRVMPQQPRYTAYSPRYFSAQSDPSVRAPNTSSQQPSPSPIAPGSLSQHASCPVHGPRPTCCPHHEEQGFVTDDESESENDSDSDEDMDDEEFRGFLRSQIGRVSGQQQRASQSNSAPSSLRQESPFLRGGASPTVAHHLHSSSASVTGRRRRVDKDREEYNEDYEVDANKPVDVPPLVWSDDESGCEEDHDIEEISSDSEQTGEPQTAEQRERLQRYLMANLSNAIMSNFFHQHDHDDDSDADDDDDDGEYYDDEYDDEDEDEVPFVSPFALRSNAPLITRPAVPHTNEQGGFQFNFDQPFNPSLNRQAGFQFNSTLPQNTSFNFTQTTTSSTGQQSGSATHVQSVNYTWSFIDNSDDGESAEHSDFDPNSLHDVD